MKKKSILAITLIATFVVYMAITAIDYSPLALLAGLILTAIDTFAIVWYFSN